MILANNFREVLKVFNSCNVDYLIAGGYAVIFHGYGRTTGDIDIWVKPNRNNQKKIISAFKTMDWCSELIDHLHSLDFTKPFSIKLGDEPIQIDIFNAITGVKYKDAEIKSIPYTFSSDLNVRFIHINDLITNKMLTGRLKDQADVEALQKIQKYRSNE